MVSFGKCRKKLKNKGKFCGVSECIVIHGSGTSDTICIAVRRSFSALKLNHIPTWLSMRSKHTPFSVTILKSGTCRMAGITSRYMSVLA